MIIVSRKILYFVLHLEEQDRPSLEMAFQIQVLNSDRQAVNCGYVDNQIDNLEIEGLLIPLDVIQAARRQQIGKGDYVNESGNSITPF